MCSLLIGAQADRVQPSQAVAALPDLIGPQCAALAACLLMLPRTLLPPGRRQRAPAPPLPPAAVALATARLHILFGILSLVSNAAVLLLKSDASRMREPVNAAVTLLSFLILGLPLAVVPALLPATCARHRRPILALTCLAYFALPTIRDPRAASNILRVRPGAGRGGCARAGPAASVLVLSVSMCAGPFFVLLKGPLCLRCSLCLQPGAAVEFQVGSGSRPVDAACG